MNLQNIMLLALVLTINNAERHYLNPYITFDPPFYIREGTTLTIQCLFRNGVRQSSLIKDGQDVVDNCQVFMINDPDIEVKRCNDSTNIMEVMIHNLNFHKHNATRWICRENNNDSKSKYLEIQKPVTNITMDKSIVAFEEGNEIKITCSTDSSFSKPEVLWFIYDRNQADRKDSIYPKRGDETVTWQNGTVMVKSELKFEARRFYNKKDVRCLAVTEGDSTTKEDHMQLQIKYLPSEVYISNTEEWIIRNISSSIICYTSGDSNSLPLLKLRKVSGGKVYILMKDQSLFLEYVQAHNETIAENDEYFCEAELSEIGLTAKTIRSTYEKFRIPNTSESNINTDTVKNRCGFMHHNKFKYNVGLNDKATPASAVEDDTFQPTIKLEPSNELKEGATLTIRCLFRSKVGDRQHVLLMNYRDVVENCDIFMINDPDIDVGSCEKSSTEMVVKIHNINFNQRNGTRWTCRENNNDSEPKILQIIKPITTVSLEKCTTTFQVGKYMKFTCKTVFGYPRPDILWHLPKSQHYIFGSEYETWKNGMVKLKSQVRVRATREMNEQEIYCIAVIPISGSLNIVQKDKMKITVTYLPDEVLISNTDDWVFENGTTTITCTTRSDSRQTNLILRLNRIIGNDRHTLKEGKAPKITYIYTAVRAGDVAFYCEAAIENAHHSMRSRSNIQTFRQKDINDSEVSNITYL